MLDDIVCFVVFFDEGVVVSILIYGFKIECVGFGEKI